MFFTSGVDVAWWLPPLVAFVIGAVVASGGISGAFLLLPFQVSVLGFSSPAVTPTNHLYNTVSIPSGVWRYFREGRMLWPLAGVIVAGTLPGVAVGSWVRVRLLPDPAPFKLFVGCVLLFIGGRLLWESVLLPLAARIGLAVDRKGARENVPVTSVEVTTFTWRRLAYRFGGREWEAGTPWLFLLSAVVGVIGGAYGVGGGAIIAPFLTTFFELPIYTIAGATLLGTFCTSLFGVIFFAWLAPLWGDGSLAVAPDWALGTLFGVGGFFGIYIGARIQRYLPQRLIKTILAVIVTALAARYVIGYFVG